MPSDRLTLWGSELSPYALKTRAMLRWAGQEFEWLPADGSRWRNLRVASTLDRAKRRRTIRRYPATTDLDEYPLTPLLIDRDGTPYYDSTGIARWLDDRHPSPRGPLLPADPALRFVTLLIDEALDEFGLYMVHHNRWVLAAATNDAGKRLAHEFRRVWPPGTGGALDRWFSARQARRLPYLFSVAPPGLPATVPASRQPPERAGFPPTHALLDDAFLRYLRAIEPVLRARPFLFGASFTLADASVYGQLGMNLTDPTANDLIRREAPATHAWLERVDAGHHASGAGPGPVGLDDAITPLLAAIRQTFVPLMEQNAAAYDQAIATDTTVFNEAAFDRNQALYDGVLLGRRFRHVVKTFQVQVWRELRDAWAALDEPVRETARMLTGGEDPLTPLHHDAGIE